MAWTDKATVGQLTTIRNFYERALGYANTKAYMAKYWQDKNSKEASVEIERLVKLRSNGQWTGPLDMEEQHKLEVMKERQKDKLKLEEVLARARGL